jgi:hypothetical protein
MYRTDFTFICQISGLKEVDTRVNLLALVRVQALVTHMLRELCAKGTLDAAWM